MEDGRWKMEELNMITYIIFFFSWKCDWGTTADR